MRLSKWTREEGVTPLLEQPKGDLRITLDNGEEFILRQSDGGLEIRVQEGTMALFPEAGNVVVVERKPW